MEAWALGYKKSRNSEVPLNSSKCKTLIGAPSNKVSTFSVEPFFFFIIFSDKGSDLLSSSSDRRSVKPGNLRKCA